MNRERSVLHLNVTDFAVAAERVNDSSLRRRPVIVAPLQAARAAVYDMSEEAYGDGVRKGMLLRQAVRLCRSARVLPPRFDLYRKAMAAVVDEARTYTPILEYGVGDGHVFLDVTGTHRLIGVAADVGWRLRGRVRQRMGVEPIWSLAANKLVAKVASRLVKPVGEYIVGPGEETAFLAPLPLALLPGVEPREMRRLDEFNINRIGELAALSRPQLVSVFGRRGDTLYDLSRGVDSDQVRTEEQQPPAVACSHVFADDTGERRLVEGAVIGLAARIGMDLRTAGQVGRRLTLHLDYTDGAQVARQSAVRRGTADECALRSMALLALERAWKRRTRVRGCRLVCDRLHRRSPQLPLFAEPGGAGAKQQRLLAAMDAVRTRFGAEALRLGVQAPAR